MRKSIYFFLLFLPILGFAQNIFIEPKMSYIHHPNESISELIFNSNDATIESIQSEINQIRTSFPNNIIRITLTGIYTVTTSSLQISDKMVLILHNATIQAASSASVTSLISVSNSRYVTISSVGTSILDGNNQNITGILISNSGKTHVDNLTIRNCITAGISYTGFGADVYADAGSVTRCIIQNCTTFGIYSTNSFNFICTDNIIQNCNVGIYMNSNYAGVVNNAITGCDTGIHLPGQYDAVSYNIIEDCKTGVYVQNTNSQSFVAHNTIKDNTTGLSLSCGNARIYYNTFQNNTNSLSGSGSNNTQLFSNMGLSISDATGKNCIYFNPPLIGNQHNDLIKIGRTRIDINVPGGSISSIRNALDNARNANPTAVIVAHLNGTFETTGLSDSLLVKQDECILLKGTISNGSDSTGTVVYFKDNIISSFSGGTIDGEDLNGGTGLIWVTGSSTVILDSITVNNSKGQGIAQRSNTGSAYVRGCTVYNSASRNIWQLAGGRMYAFSNVSTYANLDGLDFDAYTSNSIAMNNVLNNNNRNGIFIEEGAKNHIAINNTASYNKSPGIQIYNRDVKDRFTDRHLIAHNTLNYNYRGVHLNALSEDRCTKDNVIFNNTCNNNTDVGIGGLYNSATSKNNYIVFNSAEKNRYGTFYAKRDYSINTDWNLLYPSDITTTNKLDFNSFKINVITSNDLKNTFNIQISGSDSPTIIRVLNLNGILLQEVKGGNGVNLLNISNMPAGMYVIQVSNNYSTLVAKAIKR